MSSGIEPTTSLDDALRESVDAVDGRKLFCFWQELHLNWSSFEYIPIHYVKWAILARDLPANKHLSLFVLKQRKAVFN